MSFKKCSGTGKHYIKKIKRSKALNPFVQQCFLCKNGYYLETAVSFIKKFLRDITVNIAFIPFASADNNYEEYVFKVSEALKDSVHKIDVVMPEKAQAAIEKSDVIMVVGGNIFKLLHDIYDLNLLNVIRDKVNAGAPYIGWSAGPNIAGPTLGTTNDMPIVEPKSFKALGLFPFRSIRIISVKKQMDLMVKPGTSAWRSF